MGLFGRISRVTIPVALCCAVGVLVPTAMAGAAACDGVWRRESVPVSGSGVAVNRSGQLWVVADGMAYRRDSTGWHQHPAPWGVTLHQVVSRPGAVWALGTDASGASVVVRWTPSGWHAVALPIRHASLRSIAMSASDNVWISGSTGDPWAGGRALALQYDGGSWRLHVLPRGSNATAVDSRSPNDTWVAGSAVGGYPPVTWHWNGVTWAREVPRLGSLWGPGDPTSIVALPGGEAWMSLPNDAGDCCHYFPVILRHKAAVWVIDTAAHEAYMFVPVQLLLDPAKQRPLLIGAGDTDSGGGGNVYGVIEAFDGSTWRRQFIEGATPTGNDWYVGGADGDGHGNRYVVGRAPDGTPLLAHQCIPG